MNPNPLELLKNFTVPLLIIIIYKLIVNIVRIFLGDNFRVKT